MVNYGLISKELSLTLSNNSQVASCSVSINLHRAVSSLFVILGAFFTVLKKANSHLKDEITKIMAHKTLWVYFLRDNIRFSTYIRMISSVSMIVRLCSNSRKGKITKLNGCKISCFSKLTNLRVANVHGFTVYKVAFLANISKNTF